MKTIYYTATSLDGYIATDEDSLDWLLQFSSEDPTYAEFIANIGAVAMGKSTYLWLLNRHRATKGDEPFRWYYSQPSWVFASKDLEPPVDGDVRFVRGDVRPVHAQMLEAAGGKGVWLVGGGELVGQFHDHGLLDEVIATIAPVALGSGKPLLPRRIDIPPMELGGVRQVGPCAQWSYRMPRGATP